MNNAYPISYIHATENFINPQKIAEFLELFSPPFLAVFMKELDLLGKDAFFEKISRLASYQIFAGLLDLNDIPGRKEFFDYYKRDKNVVNINRTAPGKEFVCRTIK